MLGSMGQRPAPSRLFSFGTHATRTHFAYATLDRVRYERVLYEPNWLLRVDRRATRADAAAAFTHKMFDEWLRRPGATPADVALKTRCNAPLGISW